MAKGLTAPMKKMPLFKNEPRPQRPRTKPAFPTGPRALKLQQEPERLDNIFAKMPEGFDTAHTSSYEWPIYAALSILLGEPKDPTKAPFVGSPPLWSYQKHLQGGRHTKGGFVADFVVDFNGKLIGLRTQTDFYHLQANSAQRANDFFLRSHTKEVEYIIDIYDKDYIWDPTGKAACAVVAKALRLQQNPDPVRGGTFFPTRRAK